MRNRSTRRAFWAEDFYCGRGAFTLTELLVVMGVVAMLAVLCMPALGKGRTRSQDVGCLNNMRQMTTAWRMYAGDNNDRLVPNVGFGLTSWVAGDVSWFSGSSTNSALLTQGLLGPYTAQNVEIYHCPADPSAELGQGLRVRSISMNGCVGQRDIWYPLYGPPYKQLIKGADFVKPSRVFIFLDEHPDSLNDGMFAPLVGQTTSPTSWGDMPASHHNGAGSFSFGDGHAEFRKWLNPSTRRPIQFRNLPSPISIPTGQTQDINWIVQGLPM